MNEIKFTGYLGADAQVRDANNQKVIGFSVGTTKTYTNKDGEKKSITTWIECSLWGKSDTFSTYLTKGKHVLISGEPSASAYIPKDSTEAKATLLCNVSDIEFLDKAPVQ